MRAKIIRQLFSNKYTICYTQLLCGMGIDYHINAFDSQKNSGAKIIFEVLYFFLTDSVYPKGIVLFITIMAVGFTFFTFWITSSTAGVTKKIFVVS